MTFLSPLMSHSNHITLEEAQTQQVKKSHLFFFLLLSMQLTQWLDRGAMKRRKTPGAPKADTVAPKPPAKKSKEQGAEDAPGQQQRVKKPAPRPAYQCVLNLNGHARPVSSVKFSLDGGRVASASADRTVKVCCVGCCFVWLADDAWFV